LNGLETAFAMSAVVFAFSLATQSRTPRLLAACCGVLPFVRPELTALSLMLMGWLAWTRLRSRTSLESLGAWVIDITICVAAALPFLLLLRGNTGSFIPNSVAAKEYYFAEAFLLPTIKWLSVRHSIYGFATTIGLIAAALLFLTTDVLGVLALCFVTIFLGAYYLKFPGALAHYEHRYLYILFPVMVLGACRGLRSRNHYLRLAATTLLLFTGIQYLITLPASWRDYVRNCEFTRHQVADVVGFCSRSLPPGSRLLIHDAGYLAYATRLEMIDLVGLKTPAAISYHRALTYPTNGLYRSIATSRLALATHPNYLVVLNRWDRIFDISNGLRRTGWTLEKIWGEDTETEALSPFHPSYEAHYVVYRLSPPL
jgi:hypothetical protein